MPRQRYSDEEVREILRRAIEREQDETGRLGRGDIIAAAGELGIDEVAVERAITDVARDREVEAEMSLIREKRKRDWLSHVGTWAVVNAFLFIINWVSAGGWWFYWPLIGWGIAVALQAVGVLFPDEQKDRSKAEKRLDKRQAERAKKARKTQRKRAEQEFEQAVERGVHAFLGAAARRIEQVADALDGGGGPSRGARVELDDEAAALPERTAEERAARELAAEEEAADEAARADERKGA